MGNKQHVYQTNGSSALKPEETVDIFAKPQFGLSKPETSIIDFESAQNGCLQTTTSDSYFEIVEIPSSKRKNLKEYILNFCKNNYLLKDLFIHNTHTNNYKKEDIKLFKKSFYVSSALAFILVLIGA